MERQIVVTTQIVLPMIWEDPPNDEPGQLPWKEMASVLKENPNKWAKLFVSGPYYTHLKKEKLTAFRPTSDFEIKQVNHQLYIRYVGKPS